MYNFKANSISTIVPSTITSKYPLFEEFIRSYYEWQQKTTLELEGTIGNVDFSEKLYGSETGFSTDLEVTIDSNRKVLTEFENGITFIRGEPIIAYTEQATPVEITIDGEKNFYFNQEHVAKVTLYRNQTYRFTNNTGVGFYIKDRRSGGSSSQYSEVTNNGGFSGTIEITITDDTPGLLYFSSDANTNIGTFDIKTIPAQLLADFIQSGLEDVSIWGFARVGATLFHSEYLYENFTELATINTPDAFFEQYLSDYGLESLFKDNFRARRAVNDFIRFFQKKGTEDAIRFFFSNFFDKDISISYPGEVVLKPSDSEFFSREQLYVTSTDRSIEFTRNRRIVGERSGTTAIIEAYTFDSGRQFYRLYLDKEKITGQFFIDEFIQVIDDNDSSIIYETGSRVLGTVADFDIIEPGTEYEVDEVISNSYLIAGESLIVNLRIIDITSSSVNRLSIDAPGSGYSEGDEIIFPTPNKKTQFYGIVQPQQPSGNTTYTSHSIYIDLKDTDAYTLNWDRAVISISGIAYNTVSYDEVNGVITLDAEIGAPTVTAGAILNIFFPAANVTDPYFADEYFHPSRNVQKRAAKAYVSAVTESGYVTAIDIQENGLGYTKRPTTASGIQIISESGNGLEISTIGQNFGGVLKLESESDIIKTSFDIIVTLQRGDEPQDSDARVRFFTDSISRYGEFFEGNRGFLSDQMYIHDSYYYQDYSYVIESDLNFSDFADLYRRLAHPAGLIFFNQYLIINIFRQKINNGNDALVAPKTINIEKLPDSNGGIDFSLVTLQTLSAFIIHLLHRQWQDEFRWRSETVQSLNTVWDEEGDGVQIVEFSGVTLERNGLIPRTLDESPIDHFRTIVVITTVSGTGTIDYADTTTSGISDFSTVSGTGTQFTTETSRFDLILAGGETLMVHTVNTDTELIAQRINEGATSPVTLTGESFQITQKRKTELNFSNAGDMYQFGDALTLGDVSDIPVSGWDDVFLNI